MTSGAFAAPWSPARLVVLSDRRPLPGAPRTELEAATEAALREHDGIWLAGGAGAEPRPGDEGAGSSGAAPWSPLDGEPAGSSADEWGDYTRENAAYAEGIIDSISRDGAVWVAGHRWLLVAAALRALGHRGPIGLLLDVSLPAPERLEALPWHAEVMSALCQFDLVWFRTPACVDVFDAARARAGLPRPWIGVSPGTAGAEPATWVPTFLQLLAFAGRRAGQIVGVPRDSW